MRKKLIVYVLSKFPKLSETFILREITAHQKAGYEIKILSLIRPAESVRHPGQDELISETSYATSLFNPVLWFAHITEVLRSPKKYFGIIFRLLAEVFPRPKLLVEVIYLFAVSIPWCAQIRKLQPAHIHAHFAGASATSARIISRLSGIPFSMTAHANDIFVDAYGLKGKINEAAFTVTVTKYNADYLQEISPGTKNRIYVMPTALDPDEFPMAGGSGDIDCIRIISIGRLVEKKGFEYLIKALALLKEKCMQFKCSIIGEGPLKEKLQMLIDKSGLNEMITLDGAQTMPGIIEYYGNSDIFVLPCIISSDGDRDGLPHTIIESMACGLPTVCTDVLGIGELISNGENGMLVAEKDHVALADDLERLMRDHALRRNLGAAARRRIQEDYDINKTAARLRSLMGV